MKNLSVFSLIRISNEDVGAKKELKERYDIYKQRESCLTSENINPVDYFRVIDLIDNGVKNTSNFKDSIERLDDESSFSILQFLKKITDKDIEKIVLNNCMKDYLCYGLLNAKSFTTIYIFLYFANYVDYSNENAELNEILKIYSQNVFFSLHALSLLKQDEDYPRLKHNFYYKNVEHNLNKGFDFYLEYPDVETPSLYFYLRKYVDDQEKANKFLIVYDEDNFDKTALESLIEKYLVNLEDFDVVLNLIQDFDEYFIKNGNVKEAVRLFFKIAEKCDGKKGDYACELILTLYTRCYYIKTLQFAISLTRAFRYRHCLKKLYNSLKDLCTYEVLFNYCYYALELHPHIQPILNWIGEFSNNYVKSMVVEHLDLSIKRNYCFVRDEVVMVFPLTIIRKINIFDLMKKQKLNYKDVSFINNIVYGVLFLCNYDEVSKVLNIDELFDAYFNEFLLRNDIDNHFIKVFLLNACDDSANANVIYKDKIKKLIMSRLIYEDEVTYLDDIIRKKIRSPEELSRMLEYYNHYPEKEVIKCFKKSPFLRTALLFNIKEHSSFETFCNCLFILNDDMNVPRDFLGVKEVNNHDELDSVTLRYVLIMEEIVSVLSNIVYLFPKIYRVGIQFFFLGVRKEFYKNLVKINEKEPIDDQKILSVIESNYSLEKDKDILACMEKLLGISVLKIS